MSVVAWHILAVLIMATEPDYEMHYLPSWELRRQLGIGAFLIESANVKYGIGNEYEKALHELVQLGLVQEMPDLGERWQLVVK